MVTETQALAFAKEKHKNQRYGSHPYDVHFLEVVALLKKYGADKVGILAGYLHDTMEDTETTYEEIKFSFGVDVADIVYLLTDKPGKNRTERHLATYHLIRGSKTATLVKLCDRMANMQQCLRSKDLARSKMYSKEYMSFKFALFSDIVEHEQVWKDLDEVFKQMQKII